MPKAMVECIQYHAVTRQKPVNSIVLPLKAFWELLKIGSICQNDAEIGQQSPFFDEKVNF